MKIMSDDNSKEEMKLKMNCAYGKRNDKIFAEIWIIVWRMKAHFLYEIDFFVQIVKDNLLIN